MIYTEEPEDFEVQAYVAGCFIEHEGKILLLHRHPEDSFGHWWGLPAGGIDKNEDPETAVLREIHEETGLQLTSEQIVLLEKLYVDAQKRLVFYQYRAKLQEKPIITLNPEEHVGYAWVTPEEALKKQLLPDIDVCIDMFYGTGVVTLN